MKKLFDDLTVLGDVHLGRKFITGVPKHRLGEREEMVWADFEDSLLNCETRFHVQVGDIFDTFVVPPEVVLRTAAAYRRAQSANPNTQYILYRGNHDASRDANKRSSFDLLAQILASEPNIMVVVDEPEVVRDYAFIPWHPFRSAAEQVKMLDIKETGIYRAVFGHFDDKSYGDSDFNVIPFAALKGLTEHIVTGHIHTARDYEQEGFRVTITGSMQPYSHGEDPEGKLYRTLTLAELIADPNGFANMNLRVVVQPGDEVPEVNCLSLILRKADAPEDDEPADIEVTFDDFDMDKLFNTCLAENAVTGDIASQISSKFKELRNI